MYLGRIVELADNAELFGMPLHPYSEALLAAAPLPEPGLKRERIVLQGDVPSPTTPPPGCHFHTRCLYAQPFCKVETPKLVEVRPAHWVACHLRPAGGPFERLTLSGAAADGQPAANLIPGTPAQG
jgi:oligopeptide/dipeptide ABC transporter ATP-binding protein